MNDFLSYGSRQILQIDLQLITIPRKEGRGGCMPAYWLYYRWLANTLVLALHSRKTKKWENDHKMEEWLNPVVL